jgi:hypothetical protein
MRWLMNAASSPAPSKVADFQTLQNLLSGMIVDLAVRDTDAVLYRVSYSITVQGKMKFVTSLG